MLIHGELTLNVVACLLARGDLEEDDAVFSFILNLFQITHQFNDLTVKHDIDTITVTR